MWERYNDGEYYANVNGCKCWVLKAKNGWHADVYDSQDNIIQYIRPTNAGPLSFREAKEQAINVATKKERFQWLR